MSQKNTILYFSPHQDDELLTLGIHMAKAARKVHNVHVILCSDGSKSGVRKILNNGKTCKKHKGEHVYDLSTDQFINTRDREFTDSCLALGVKAENIHIPANRGIDGSLDTETCKAIILEHLDKLGRDSLVCTISPDNGPNQHRDHKALGRAAVELYDAEVIKELRLFVEPYCYADTVENPRWIPVAPTVQKAGPFLKGRINKAIAAYSLWAPEQERYAVGYHSVKNEFNDFLKEKTCYSFLKKREKHMDRWERYAQRHRKWRKFHSQKQLYYTAGPCSMPELGELRLVTAQPNDTAGYEAVCRAYGMDCRKKDLERITKGSGFWGLALADGTMVSTGWLGSGHDFYIGEMDYDLHIPEDVAILFDFNTKPEHRGNGYYGKLLQCMMSAGGCRKYVIYTSPDNKASDKGIRKAGFRYDGTFTGGSGSYKTYLKQQGLTNLSRRYRLFGLRVY